MRGMVALLRDASDIKLDDVNRTGVYAKAAALAETVVHGDSCHIVHLFPSMNRRLQTFRPPRRPVSEKRAQRSHGVVTYGKTAYRLTFPT